MHRIEIKRLAKNGILTFTSPGKSISMQCYWNTAKKIPAGIYMNCSATTMARKRNTKGMPREAVFLPNVTGFSEIFIHMGKSPYEKWSDGCIIVGESKMVEMYNSINPKNGHNVTVVING